MSRLVINRELSLSTVVITIFEALEVIGIDTESLTMDELFIIKRALFDGIAEVNAERELAEENKQQ
jgi:hypothetical protein